MIEHLRDKGLGVGFACRALGLSESAYYARKKRPKSARRLRDEQLMPLIEQVHADSGGTYGVRRITRALRRKGVHVARCTVERLMAELGLEGVIRGRRRRTTVPEPSPPGRRTWSTVTSPRAGPTSSGWPTRPMSAPGQAGCTWRSSWTSSPGRSSDGRSRTTCGPNFRWKPWRWRCGNAGSRRTPG